MVLIYRGVIVEDRRFEVILSFKKFADKRIEILTWCYENFGNMNDNGLWDLWVTSQARFVFLKETDATAFKLRWV